MVAATGVERHVRIAGAIALVAVAVLAALLAVDVRSWRSTLAQGDAVYAVTPGKATWTPPTVLGGAARSLLGTGDDVDIRRALQLYAVAAATPRRLDTAVERQTLRSQAQSRLAAAARGRSASQAETLLGILAFQGPSGVDEATADFTNAVRADPTNAAAKYDLELMLRLTQAHGSRTGAGSGNSFGKGGRRGAGGGGAGGGY
jgi:uncharacterized membrane protein YgcG